MNELQFIEQYQNKKIPEIALLLSKQSNLDKDFILNQINGIQKAKNKLPELANTNGILFPAKLSLEQCSSEQTAIYKSGLNKFNSVIDLTGGFGVDSYYFSKKAKQVTYIEPNKNLFKIVEQNFKTLGANNVQTINSTCEEFLKTNTQKFDLAYIDPSRRNENQKVFILADCVPNIVELQTDIFNIAPKILVKTSPILDIKQSIKELKTVSEVWVISVNNECKEVLYLLEDKSTTNPQINTVNIGNSLSTKDVILSGVEGKEKKQKFSFDFETEENTNTDYSEPLNYLYEPNASILKAGAFKSITQTFEVKKIASNTHLYTSENLIKDFPGRVFKIEKTIPYQPKAFKKLGIKKANVSCRNFKESVEQVKKKLNVKDGGDIYLFTTTDKNNKAVLFVNSKA